MKTHKPCKVCGSEKCLDAFSRNNTMSDGRINTCKACEAAYRRAYSLLPHVIERRKLTRRKRLSDPSKRQKQDDHMRRWRSLPENKLKIAERRKRYYTNNPHKKLAHKAVERAVRLGQLVPEPCCICGKKAMAHHEDYSNPLEVVWLCPKHHIQLHAGLITSVAEAQSHLRELDKE